MAGLANAAAINQSRQFGAGVGQNMFNNAMANQQFGANLAQQLGQAGVGNILSGANMYNTGVGMSQGVGQMQRAYEQQLLQNQFQQGMAPFNAAQYLAGIVGDPNNLSRASSSSTGKSSGFSIGF